MPGRRSRKAGRAGQWSYLIMALVIVGVMALGTVAGVIADRGGSGGPGQPDDRDQTSTDGEADRLRTAVAANPDDVESALLLAEVLANSGEGDEAIATLSSVVAKHPDDQQVRLTFGRTLLRTGDSYDAEIQLRKAVALDPEDQASAFYLALALEGRGTDHYGDAGTWFQKTIDLGPDTIFAEQARDGLARVDATPVASPSP